MAAYNCCFSHDSHQEDDGEESADVEYTTVQLRLWKLEEQEDAGEAAPACSRQCRIRPAEVLRRLEAPALELASGLTELQVLEWCQPRMIELATDYIREIHPPPETVLMDIMEAPEDVEEGVRRSTEVMTPASEEAIGGVERVIGGEGECPICLEKDEEEEKGFACMPCSHSFHVKCIQVWLRISRFCPLCRFPMPC
uniref:RING-type E3 ubiquitin transferase n=1 Tax=Kalanchoe fedtschenkoi TaxID=63787 RepID=A0A7N0UB87_KALFE